MKAGYLPNKASLECIDGVLTLGIVLAALGPLIIQCWSQVFVMIHSNGMVECW